MIKHLLYLLLLFPGLQKATAQIATIHLEPATKKPLTRPFPFHTVRVIDNRPDTLHISPFATLDCPTAEALQEYFSTVTYPVRTGDRTLLINIRKLSTATPSHYYTLYFKIDTYYTSDGITYHPYLSLKYDFLPRHSLPQELPLLLARVVKKLSQAKKPIDSSLTFEQINIPARQHWLKDYPALAHLPSQNGAYHSFGDFRKGALKHDTISLQFNTIDSVYHFANTKRTTHPYVISEDSSLFILLPTGSDSYVKLTPDNGTFRFRVPTTLPDMQSLITIDHRESHSSSHSHHSGGSWLGTLAAGVIQSAIDESLKSREIKNIREAGFRQEEGRSCLLDMDTGDIAYQ